MHETDQGDPNVNPNVSAVERDLFKSVPEDQVAGLPRPSPEDIRAAIERGRQARAKAESAFQPGTASSSRVFYK